MILKLPNTTLIWGMGVIVTMRVFLLYNIWQKCNRIHIYSKCITYVFTLKIWHVCDDFLKTKMLNYSRKIFYLCDTNFYVGEVWAILDQGKIICDPAKDFSIILLIFVLKSLYTLNLKAPYKVWSRLGPEERRNAQKKWSQTDRRKGGRTER